MSSSKKSNLKCLPKYVPSLNLAEDMKLLGKCLNNDEEFRKIIYQLFSKQVDPLIYALELLVAMKFNSKNKAKKLNLVIETLERFCKDHNIKNVSRTAKADAIDKAVILCDEEITKKICSIFLLEDEKDYIKHMIHSLLKEKKIKIAFYLMSTLNLEKEFALEEFAYPAFLLDYENMVKSYLQKCPLHLQLKFVKTLDSLYQNPHAIREFAESLNIEGLDKSRPFYNPKWMKKRLPTYIEFLKIDIKECPNVYFARLHGAIYYLIRKRYTEESIEPEAFEELVSDLVFHHPSLQKEVLIKLVCVNDSTAAYMLAKTLNLNENQLPDCLRAFPPPSKEFVSLYYQGSQLKDSTDFLSLRLSQSDIIFVNSLENYLYAVDDISNNYDVVGIDAEWKPNLGIIETKLSLLQVAVWDVIYLFDVKSLMSILSKIQWDYIFTKIFCNKDMLKLGYGLENDLVEFLKVINFEKENYPRSESLVDLFKVYNKIKHNYPDILNTTELTESSSSEDSNSKGLSQLCKVVLGKPLNKREQFSNWERRPLRDTQLQYAALDAYCILMIYEKLYHILKDLNLTLDQLITMPLSTVKKKIESPNPKMLMPFSIEDFKVVTDCMLNGLGKYLRMFGADVICLNEGDDPRCALEIALAEKRIILTCGNRYEKLKGYMPDNMVFCVNNQVDLKRQVADIQNHFNLKLDESTIFSRCSVCNNSNFFTIQNEALFTLWCNLVDDETKWVINNSKKKVSTCYDCDIITADGVVKKIYIQLATVSAKVFETVKDFLICEKCGKIYWKGSHLFRLKNSVSSVIEIQPSKKGFYEVLSEESSKISPAHELNSTCNTEKDKNESTNRTVTDTKKNYYIPEDDSSDGELDDIVFS